MSDREQRVGNREKSKISMWSAELLEFWQFQAEMVSLLLLGSSMLHPIPWNLEEYISETEELSSILSHCTSPIHNHLSGAWTSWRNKSFTRFESCLVTPLLSMSTFHSFVYSKAWWPHFLWWLWNDGFNMHVGTSSCASPDRTQLMTWSAYSAMSHCSVLSDQ